MPLNRSASLVAELLMHIDPSAEVSPYLPDMVRHCSGAARTLLGACADGARISHRDAEALFVHYERGLLDGVFDVRLPPMGQESLSSNLTGIGLFVSGIGKRHGAAIRRRWRPSDDVWASGGQLA